MWTCPDCDRNFKTSNQSHMCTNTTIDEIFEGKSDALLLAFDKLLVGVIDWEPCSVGTSTKSIVFTKEKAWLIVKPMSKALDIKFYFSKVIPHKLVFKTTHFGKKYAHHIRVNDESEITLELLQLIKKGYDFA